MGLPPRPPPSSPRGMLRHGGGPHSLRLPLGSPPRLSRVQHRRRQARRRLHPQPSHGWLFPTLVTAMIPTPNLAYLAILPAVDNLATPHGEFSAIRWYIIFRRFFFSEILERCTPCFVRVFIFKHIVSPGTCLRIAFHLDKFAHVTQNSFQIVFSYNVTFRIYPQISISLHPAGLFQLQFVSLRSTTISPSTRVAGIPEALLFWPFRRAFHLHFWYLLFPLLFRCVV